MKYTYCLVPAGFYYPPSRFSQSKPQSTMTKPHEDDPKLTPQDPIPAEIAIDEEEEVTLLAEKMDTMEVESRVESKTICVVYSPPSTKKLSI